MSGLADSRNVSEPFDRKFVAARAVELANRGVFLGTSSWKYEGWLGQLYTPERYQYRGKVARTRFQRDCLGEYAEVFKTVCVDAAYYDFPRRDLLHRMSDQVPVDFRFGFKVTDALTLKTFPKLDRFGPKAGQRNPDFLHPDRFVTAFLGPCEDIREKVGVLIFEFSRFWPTDYTHGRDFVSDLDQFLGRLPRDWPYAVEMRNKAWLHDEYFACLARHGVTHVFNSWEAMPSVPEQMALPHSRANPARIVARFLLKPGRKYDAAVKAFQPYDRTREVNNEARTAGADLIREALGDPQRSAYVYVNNRLEGNALATIMAMLRQLGSE